ncbi:uncharacterized protein E5676_scaffold259G00140 [Cucumis melo var. makuwa]|uniref:Uncharacterized protein n=1 Tax=Cucumis melo var. makuwa TaxID=1194695 RepID=A0A5D3CUJ2_CUCMM|nr:uncharacterized protein E6C27_scaffold538G001120 [Cucumis melo var. makuwa]TYK15090.1 uncharacterized protein E5676_scaffold259G00140 [Cucumis melo var. makuwa]
MPKNNKGKQSKTINEGETPYDVPLNFSLESDENNVPIAKRRLFERVLKEKGKKTQTENVSKKRKLEKVVKAREEKKDNRCTIDLEKESMVKSEKIKHLCKARCH